MASSSINYILAPLALLFLLGKATPTASTEDGISLNISGTLFCSPNITNCTTPGSCPPLVNAPVSLGLGNLINIKLTNTDNSGFFQILVNIPLRVVFKLLNNLLGVGINVTIPVNGCAILPAGGQLSLPVNLGVVGDILNTIPTILG